MKDILKKLFPFISAAASLGGPLGTMAAQAAGAALGVDKVEASLDGIAAALKGATPEQIAQMKLAEQDFKLKMEELGFKHIEELESLAVADRASARGREVSVKDWTNRILAYGVTIGFFVCIFWLFKFDLPASTRDIVLVLFGALTKMTGDVFAYYFGSSAGSERKTELIANGNGKH